MKFLWCVILIAAVSLSVGGCTQKEAEKPPKEIPANPSMHGAATPAEKGEGFVGVVKKQHLPNYPTTSVGTAFEGYRYFTKKEWSESRNTKGTVYVDFSGWLVKSTFDPRSIKDAVAARGVQVKFVIYENGSFGVAMVSKIEAKTDGKLYVYPLENSKALLDSIYANQEIAF
jgi:hypothetical protein